MLISEHYCDVKSEFDAKVPRILFKHVSGFVDMFYFKYLFIQLFYLLII